MTKPAIAEWVTEMVGVVIVGLLFLQAPPAVPATTTKATVSPTQIENTQTDKRKELEKVRRIFVESFGTDEASQQMQAMVIASLTESKRVTVTEDKTKADAVLKGFASEKRSQETHSYGSSTSVNTAIGGHSASVSGSGGNISGSSHGGFHASGAGIEDSSLNTETVNNARASVRLIDSDGDVIWTATQESNGAKYKGASADVADKIVKQLIRDIERAENVAAPN